MFFTLFLMMIYTFYGSFWLLFGQWTTLRTAVVWAKRTMAWCGRVGVGRGESGKARRPAGRCEDEDKKASRLRPVQGTVCAGTFKYCGSQAPLRKELPWHRDSGVPFSPEPGVTLPAVDGERRSHRLDRAPGSSSGSGHPPLPSGHLFVL